MSEGAIGREEDKRPQWLDVAITVLSPLTLITALLVYFAWMRRVAFARRWA
jgi:hypothetical protein